MYYKDSGAYTGEISPVFLKDMEVEYVILGHSERRQYFKEDDSEINKKVNAALDHGLKPILCVGETLVQREAGEAFDVIAAQLKGCLSGMENRLATVTLDTLSADQIGEYIGYLVNRPDERVALLSEVIYRKTNGNPFFLIHFLRSIYDNRYLRCVSTEGWTWDLDMIKGMQVSDNVVELMIDRINSLSPTTPKRTHVKMKIINAP